MDLELAGRATIKNMNVRCEHHGEERELGVDLRLQLSTDLDALANFSPTLKAMLYTDEKALRMPQLKPLGLTCEFENHSLCIADQTWDGVKLSRFEITAEPEGKISLAFNASMSSVDPTILPAIAALYLEETVNIDVSAAQSELRLEEAAA